MNLGILICFMDFMSIIIQVLAILTCIPIDSSVLFIKWRNLQQPAVQEKNIYLKKECSSNQRTFFWDKLYINFLFSFASFILAFSNCSQNWFRSIKEFEIYSVMNQKPESEKNYIVFTRPISLKKTFLSKEKKK